MGFIVAGPVPFDPKNERIPVEPSVTFNPSARDDASRGRNQLYTTGRLGASFLVEIDTRGGGAGILDFLK